jgi:CubicO group peptidase (beta-lactamase class C family)
MLVLLLLLSLQVVSAQQVPGADFEQYVNKAMTDWGVPGVAIAIVKDDRIVFAKGFGVRELGKPAAVDEHTLFAIGSSSKAFTAASIGLLVDEGKLKWEDPATKYLPGFQLFDPYSTRELTVSDLLTHRSGLTRGDLLWYASAYDRNEVLRRVRYLKPSWSLRSRFGYQNIMFLAAGQSFPPSLGGMISCANASLLHWAEVSNTSIRALANSDDVASPHAKLEDKVQVISWRNIDNIAPAGSINSNVEDMAQWLRLQLGGGTYQNQRLLSSGVMKEMHTPQTIIRIEGVNAVLHPCSFSQLRHGLVSQRLPGTQNHRTWWRDRWHESGSGAGS